MANFRILVLKSKGTPVTRYKQDERSGFYKRCNEVGVFIDEEVRGIYDILQDGGYMIEQVQVGRQTFKLGDRISETQTIISLQSKQNRIFINGDIDATKAKLYTPPVKKVEVSTGNKKPNNFKVLQDKIEAENKPIKLGNKGYPFTHNTNESLSDFIKNFILTYSKNYDTCYVSNGNVQTDTNSGKGRRRSLGDIYMVCKHYYPECNLHEIIELLYVKLPKTFSRLGSCKCATILKRVWWDYGTPRFTQETEADEYGNLQTYYIAELKKAPVYETTTKSSTSTTNSGSEILNNIKKKYPVGVKIKSMVTGKTVKITGTELYDGNASVILIQENNARIVVYDKNERQYATIVR